MLSSAEHKRNTLLFTTDIYCMEINCSVKIHISQNMLHRRTKVWKDMRVSKWWQFLGSVPLRKTCTIKLEKMCRGLEIDCLGICIDVKIYKHKKKILSYSLNSCEIEVFLIVINVRLLSKYSIIQLFMEINYYWIKGQLKTLVWHF